MSTVVIFLVGFGAIAVALLALALGDRRAAGPRYPFGKSHDKE